MFEKSGAVLLLRTVFKKNWLSLHMTEILVQFCRLLVLTLISMLWSGLRRRSKVESFVVVSDLSVIFSVSRLLTPPATPLFSSLDMEVQKTTTNQSEITNDRASAPKSRVRILANTP